MVVTISQDRLGGAAQVAREHGEGIAQNLRSLINELEQQAASFRGTAGNSFQTAANQLAQELQTLLSALHDMADNVTKSSQSFGSTDSEAASQISKVHFQPGTGSVASTLRG